jgi:ABC-type multidrug transport system ATPase subunit
MIGILGPNGAGKTTLLRLLAAVLEPSAGTIHYGGHLKRRIGVVLSRWIGYLPQEFGLPNHLTAEEYLDYFALLYGVGNREQRRARVQTLLQEVGLSERRHEAIGGYSGGMRQRVAVARTLLRQPPIIIVDEPTVGLDPRERIRFRNLLSRLAEGRLVLFSTHVVEDVAVSCERVIVMSRGRIVFDGQPADLSQLASGVTWEVRLDAGEVPTLAAGSKLVDQVPDAGGGMRLRVLAESTPHPAARAIEPGIEDGYLRLVNFGPGAHA